MTNAITEAPTREPAAAPAERRAVRETNAYAASLTAVWVVWKRDLVRYWRDRGRVIASLMQPLLYLVIFGTGLSSLMRGGSSFPKGFNYQQFLYPGVISMAVLFTAMFGAMSIVWDREFGFMKELLVAPIDRSAIAIGKTLGGATQAMVQGVVLLVLAPFIGITVTPLMVLQVLVLVFILAFALSALGVAVGSRMKSMQGFQVVMNFLMMPIFFLSGALFPLTGLPAWLTVLTRIDPASYGIGPIRKVVLEAGGVPARALDQYAIDLFGHRLSTLEEVGIMLVFGVVMMAVAVYNFQQRD